MKGAGAEEEGKSEGRGGGGEEEGRKEVASPRRVGGGEGMGTIDCE